MKNCHEIIERINKLSTLEINVESVIKKLLIDAFNVRDGSFKVKIFNFREISLSRPLLGFKISEKAYTGFAITHENEFTVWWDKRNSLIGAVLVQFNTLVKLAVIDCYTAD